MKVTIAKKYPLPEKVHATVRYGDMLGARYIALESSRTPRRVPETASRWGRRRPRST